MYCTLNVCKVFLRRGAIMGRVFGAHRCVILGVCVDTCYLAFGYVSKIIVSVSFIFCVLSR